MEIGSFLELQFEKKKEFYSNKDVARLNSGRAAIYHAARSLGKSVVYLPYYQCDTVREFLKYKGMKIKYYHIDEKFEPIERNIEPDAAIVLVNYYGIMGNKRMRELAAQFENVIIDNCQGFFAKPIQGCMNVYSARKFVGVPDGAYVIGEALYDGSHEYEQDYSSDTSLFMLQRIEYGCEGKAYASRKMNEDRIDCSDIKLMSKLTQTILKSTDYDMIQKKRKQNFAFVSKKLESINLMNPREFMDEDTIPMVYPLVTKNTELINILQEHKHFQGQWWAYILDEIKERCMETWLSEYMIPITIDQRYTVDELDGLITIIEDNI